jgi:hypothetical protein
LYEPPASELLFGRGPQVASFQVVTVTDSINGPADHVPASV